VGDQFNPAAVLPDLWLCGAAFLVHVLARERPVNGGTWLVLGFLAIAAAALVLGILDRIVERRSGRESS
jgi:hypothetical protein